VENLSLDIVPVSTNNTITGINGGKPMHDTFTAEKLKETTHVPGHHYPQPIEKDTAHVYPTPAKRYSKGMGQAVADRTINRKVVHKLRQPEKLIIKLRYHENISLNDEVEIYCRNNGYIISHHETLEQDQDLSKTLSIALYIVAKQEMEHWKDVAYRVSKGNTALHPKDSESEFLKMHHHLRQASLLMSGRHLQHGDETQPTRNMEVFTNCATSAMSFLEFYLLLNGSGVGRAMDDELMLVDYKNLPIIVPVINSVHADVLSGEISERLEKRTAEHMYKNKTIHCFDVPDSREGWAKAIEKMEVMAFEKKHKNSVLILDFSNVRPRGAPIGGMQDRPASGPGPLILAIEKIAKLREAAMDPWRATMFADHYLAECVLVGGARRAARMATKTWRDSTIFDFINLKRGGFLWSSNNSVTVDAEFWNYIRNPEIKTQIAKHARKVFNAITEAAYHDGTGEPGIINQDKLTQNETGFTGYLDGQFAESKKFKLDSETLELTKNLAMIAKDMRYQQITNPCGEITLNLLGGYCVIADVVPYHAQNDDDACEAFATATKALMRVNLMDSMYKKEVLRTNRIGVGITGFHEWAWKRFNLGWKDIVDEEKSRELWLMLSRFKRVVTSTASEYAEILGTVTPHTDTTIKPAGTTSKLFGLTEGAHLPSMREFLRWVQFRNDDPIIEEYKAKGYPTKILKSYSGTTVVGFPTQPEICKQGLGDKLVTAAEATPEEQYQYLRLLEKYWIRGVAADGTTPLLESGNQVSYTLKYNPAKVSFEEFVETLLEGQSSVRCCSVMPQTDTSAYEYQPEEMMTTSRYQQIVREIEKSSQNLVVQKEDVAFEHIDCGSGACPIDFR
jgi:adenosylcobalamin-dependent ribonucleoside-triphosphate reductase